jgi:hypothetical protein
MRQNFLNKIKAKNPQQTAAPVRKDDKPASLLKVFQEKIAADRAELKSLQNIDDKVKAKRKMLDQYLSFVDTYIEKEHKYPNNVLVWVMTWLFDTLDIERGLTLALHLIEQDVHVMPSDFNRDMKTFVCDAIYDWANAQLKAEHTASPYLDDLVAVMERDAWEVHDLEKIKLFSMQAKHAMLQADYQAVVTLCEKAESINKKKAGVKTLKANAEKKLKAQKEAAFDADADTTDAGTVAETEAKSEPEPEVETETDSDSETTE